MPVTRRCPHLCPPPASIPGARELRKERWGVRSSSSVAASSWSVAVESRRQRRVLVQRRRCIDLDGGACLKSDLACPMPAVARLPHVGSRSKFPVGHHRSSASPPSWRPTSPAARRRPPPLRREDSIGWRCCEDCLQIFKGLKCKRGAYNGLRVEYPILEGVN
jgi:hypothetical protein